MLCAWGKQSDRLDSYTYNVAFLDVLLLSLSRDIVCCDDDDDMRYDNMYKRDEILENISEFCMGAICVYDITNCLPCIGIRKQFSHKHITWLLNTVEKSSQLWIQSWFSAGLQWSWYREWWMHLNTGNSHAHKTILTLHITWIWEM